MYDLCSYVINDNNFEVKAAPPGYSKLSDAIDSTEYGGKGGLGLVAPEPTKYAKRVRGSGQAIIPRDEWVERIQEGHANKQFCSYHLKAAGFKSLDQGRDGYCWKYSGTLQNIVLRILSGLGYTRLSAHSAACRIKNFRNEGGWNAAGVDYVMQHGENSVEEWPEKSSARGNDTPETREAALKYRIEGVWTDLPDPMYDRNLTEDERFTNLLLCNPVGADRYRWSHSTGDLDPLLGSQTRRKASLLKTDFGSLDLNNAKDAEVFFASFSTLGCNSWGEGWGDKGYFVMEGNSQKMDGGTAIHAVHVGV